MDDKAIITNVMISTLDALKNEDWITFRKDV